MVLCALQLRIVCMAIKVMAELCISKQQQQKWQERRAHEFICITYRAFYIENCRFYAMWSQRDSHSVKGLFVLFPLIFCMHLLDYFSGRL